MSVAGIDISTWQDSSDIPGHIDFVKMKGAGIQFVFQRAAFGNDVDDDLTINYPAIKAQGMLIGLYHFAYYMASPENQAALFYSILRSYPTDLPPVLDLEYFDGWGTRPSGANMAAWAARYVIALDKLTGRKTVIYTNGDISHQMLAFGAAADLAILRAHDLWFAHVDSTAPTPAEMYVWSKCAIWQYTWHGDGKLYGVESLDVDLDRYPGTIQELRIWAGLEAQTMGKWDTNAVLGWYDDAHPLTEISQLSGLDGAIIWLGRVAPDVKMSGELAGNQLQIVADAGLPAGGFFTWGFDYTANLSENEEAWADAAHDIVITKFLDPMIFMGDPKNDNKRGYSFLVIDISITNQVFGAKPTFLNNQWVREFGFKHVAKIVWDRYHIPVFLYFTPSAFKQYAADTSDQSLGKYLETLKDDNPLSTVVFSTLGTNGRPVDTASPIKDANGNLLMHCGYWAFWLFQWTTSTIRWLYNGNRTALWKAVSYEGNVTPPPPPPPPVVITDLDKAVARIIALETRVGALETWRKS